MSQGRDSCPYCKNIKLPEGISANQCIDCAMRRIMIWASTGLVAEIKCDDCLERERRQIASGESFNANRNQRSYDKERKNVKVQGKGAKKRASKNGNDEGDFWYEGAVGGGPGAAGWDGEATDEDGEKSGKDGKSTGQDEESVCEDEVAAGTNGGAADKDEEAADKDEGTVGGGSGSADEGAEAVGGTSVEDDELIAEILKLINIDDDNEVV